MSDPQALLCDLCGGTGRKPCDASVHKLYGGDGITDHECTNDGLFIQSEDIHHEGRWYYVTHTQNSPGEEILRRARSAGVEFDDRLGRGAKAAAEADLRRIRRWWAAQHNKEIPPS